MSYSVRSSWHCDRINAVETECAVFSQKDHRAILIVTMQLNHNVWSLLSEIIMPL
jgi:hypothetical protein